MKIAVTGATGFVGRRVMTELMRTGHEAVAVVRDRTHVSSWSGANVVHLDLQVPVSDSFERLGRPDSVIHLAWGGLPAYRSLHHFETELPNSYRFASALIREGLKSLVVAGTCFEYGMRSGELSEATTAPTNPYGFAKDTLRQQLEFLHGVQPFALTWARLFYLFGDGQATGSLLPQLRRAVAEGQAEFPMSRGEQLRDFIDVAEVAQHLVHFAVHQADLGAVNVCSGRPISVRSQVEGWIQENRWSIKPALGRFPYSDFEPMAFWGSRRKLDDYLLASATMRAENF